MTGLRQSADVRAVAWGGVDWRASLAPPSMVSVGHMDPGNWVVDLAGTRFGYPVLLVPRLSGFIVVVLQTLAAQLRIVANRDIAQACRDYYTCPVVALVLPLLCDLAARSPPLSSHSPPEVRPYGPNRSELARENRDGTQSRANGTSPS